MADIKQIKVGTTTYDIKDGTAREALSEKVSKAGDTMTGNLWISNGLTKGTNPTADTTRYLSFVDGQGTAGVNRTGALINQIKTDGTSYTGVYAYDFTSGSQDAQVLRLYKPPGGNGYSNVSGANVADAVIRNIKYGTAAPSGGSAGQVYLQYSADTTANPYVYAEDTAADMTTVADKYYSKSEVDAMIANITDKITYHNYAWSGTTTSEVITTFSFAGQGYVFVTGYIKAPGAADNYGLLNGTISKSDNNGSSYYEIARSEWRKHGSGYVLRPAALVSTATSAAAVTRLKVEFHRSFDNTHDWRIEILTVGCTCTRLS